MWEKADASCRGLPLFVGPFLDGRGCPPILVSMMIGHIAPAACCWGRHEHHQVSGCVCVCVALCTAMGQLLTMSCLLLCASAWLLQATCMVHTRRSMRSFERDVVLPHLHDIDVGGVCHGRHTCREMATVIASAGRGQLRAFFTTKRSNTQRLPHMGISADKVVDLSGNQFQITTMGCANFNGSPVAPCF